MGVHRFQVQGPKMDEAGLVVSLNQLDECPSGNGGPRFTGTDSHRFDLIDTDDDDDERR